jgi:hypothetical protein
VLVAAFILVNGFILAAWFVVFTAPRKDAASANLVYAGMMAAAQIVLTELVLGLTARLNRPLLITANLLCAVALLLWVARRPRDLGHALRDAGRGIAGWKRAILTWENALLGLLAAFVCIWFVVAAVFLPVRGIDDLVYHLPPLFQYAQTHRLELLPLTLRDMFAFPFNGEFLFLWPLVFFHGDALLDLAQFVVAVYGILVVYALARRFEVSPRRSAFAALLFLFTPVVLGQSGSDYVDLIAGVFHLVLLFAAFRFYTTGDGRHLAMAAVASGFLAGVKDSMLIFIAAMQPILWLRFWRDRDLRRAATRYASYWLLALPLSLYWPLRNYWWTGNPFYPMHATLTGFQLAPESTLGKMTRPQLTMMWADFLAHPEKILAFPFLDPGLGSLHGGFGVVFWGLGAPAVAYCCAHALRSAVRSGRLFPILFWGQALVGGAALLLVPSDVTDLTARYTLFVVGLGLVALGIVLRPLAAQLPYSGSILRGFCVAASLLAVVHVAGYRWPSYQIKTAVEDWRAGRYTSEYTYLQQAGWDLPSLSHAWAPLDFLTSPGPGWSVYMACGYSVFWTAPSFGSRLQNRIWNFDAAPAAEPDAFIFHHDRRGRPLYYVGRKITPEDVEAAGRYELVTQTPYTQLWVQRELLSQPEVSARLADYYAKTFGPIVAAAEPLIPLLADDGVVITASSLAYGLRYLALAGRLALPVHLVPEHGEEALAARLGAHKVYTVGSPLRGFQARPIAMLVDARSKVPIYENTKVL